MNEECLRANKVLLLVPALTPLDREVKKYARGYASACSLEYFTNELVSTEARQSVAEAKNNQTPSALHQRLPFAVCAEKLC